MKHLLKTIILLLLFCSFSELNAQTSNLSIQGILRTAEGDAVEDVETELTFKLYLQPNTGNPIWEETIDAVEVKGGIYSVILGAGATALDVPFNAPYFLGVSVEGGIELTPRARLTSSPYALSLIGNDNIFPNSGNVGVGSDDPQNKLTVQRGNGILGLEANEEANNTTVITTTTDGMTFDAGGTDKIYAFSSGRIQATADEQLTIEGVDTSQLIFTKNSGSATLGFDTGNGDDLMLKNSIGATKIEGNNIVLNTSSGTATIDGNTMMNGNTTITGNGEMLKLVGTDTSAISFYPEGEGSTKSGFIGFQPHPWGNENDLSIFNQTPNGKITLRANGSNGYVYVVNRLNVGSYISYSGSHQQFDRAIRGNSHHWSPAGTYHVSLHTTHDIMTKGVLLYSDERIKKDLNPSNGLNDLSTLRNLEVTDYKHVDTVAHGRESKKGFIAQQVRNVFKEAVTLGPGELPSIYTFPLFVEKNTESTKIGLDKPHDLKVGDQVKFVLENTNEILTVSKVLNATTFEIEGSDFDINEKTFVFGKAIDDFHSIDYDRIYTLNVSATQELARKVEILEAKLADSEKKNADLKSTGAERDATLSMLSAKLEALEEVLKMTGQR